MKLHANHSNIERGGVHSETSFTIKTNALSFSILSSGLYTDPIMAIVRELSCNAYDAHVEANNAITPFEIHLPNELEPFFSIRDFGTGLADVDIQGETVPIEAKDGTITHMRTGGLYTTYFDSTKTNSNDYIGALGLGSKSPFSYSEAFEVISRYDGTKRTYAIFLNEDGIPTVALMGKIETDEHNGLEIKIAIKKEDFHKFHARTATALKFFKVQPTIKGAINFEFDKIPKHRIETQNWMLSKSAGYYNNSITAVQGNVQYRVDSAQLTEHLSSELLTFIKNTNIVLFFDIGKLEVAANREEIRYDKQSVQEIAAGIEMVHKNLTSEIETRIGNISGEYWQACVDLNNLSSELFNNMNFIFQHANLNEVKNDILKKYIRNKGCAEISGKFGYDMYLYGLKTGYSSNKTVSRSKLGNVISPYAHTAIIINDIKTGGIKRLAEYLDAHLEHLEAILITKRKEPHEEYDEHHNVLPYIGFDAELKELREELGNPEILLLSEITEEPTKIKTERTLPFYSYNGLYSAHSYYRTNYTLKWYKTMHSIDDGGIFIPLKYGKQPALINNDKTLTTIDKDDELFHNALVFLINEYNERNGTDYEYGELYGLPSRTCKKATKSDMWINLFDFAESIVPDYKDILEFHYKKKETSNVLDIKDNITNLAFIEMVKGLANHSVFKKAVLPLMEKEKLYGTDSLNLIDNIKTIDCIKKSFLPDFELTDQKSYFNDKTFNKYEMLTLVSNISYDTNWNVLKKYIRMIDRSK